MEQIQGVYVISVAARLLNMHPQTLRKYERAGFIEPSRTGGMLRLYSAEDIQQLQLIKHLVEELGLNLAGVQLVLALARRLLQTREHLATIKSPAALRRRLQKDTDEMMRMLGSSF
ncbi:MAG: MerR family transcriptional regulator [Chloroflexota bacterium]|nr:MerR family transcriptional regulator [Chloroflexota bacterium]